MQWVVFINKSHQYKISFPESPTTPNIDPDSVDWGDIWRQCSLKLLIWVIQEYGDSQRTWAALCSQPSSWSLKSCHLVVGFYFKFKTVGMERKTFSKAWNTLYSRVKVPWRRFGFSGRNASIPSRTFPWDNYRKRICKFTPSHIYSGDGGNESA